MSYRFLYVVPHGQYHRGKDGENQLTKLGVTQVKHPAWALQGVKFNRINRSPIYRAVQPTDIIAQTHPNAIIQSTALLPPYPEKTFDISPIAQHKHNTKDATYGELQL